MPRVTFHPDFRTVDVRQGERLLVAAWKAGVGIKSVCGGRGKCGSCLVEVDMTTTGPDALTPRSGAEQELLPTGSEHPGYRLACLCDVRTDVVLSVPPESQAVRSAPRKPYTVTHVTPRPTVTRVHAEVHGRHSKPLLSLTDRLQTAIARAARRKSVELPVEVVAEFSVQPGFDSAREVTATIYQERRVLGLVPVYADALYGVAIDVGTTSIVAFLCDLARGEIVGMRTASNPQAIYGEDVISRMTYIQKNPEALAEMRGLLVAELNRLVKETAVEAGVSPLDIVDAVVVGNPTMQHILLGVNPEPLGRAPYVPVWAAGVDVDAR